MSIAAGYVPDEILVGFDSDVATAYGTHGAAAALAAAGEFVGPFGLERGSVLLAAHDNRTGAAQLATRWHTPGNANLSDLITSLSKLPGVAYAEPNYIAQAATVPNDPRFAELWGLQNTGQTGGAADADIDAPEAWDITSGNGSVVVGVIDTGVDYAHPDLAANIWTNPGEVTSDGVDNDGNGYVDDVHGWDFVNNDNDPFDDFGHGTHVAGTIAAAGNNLQGVVGVNWNAKIMALKFLNANGNGTTADAIAAINYATMMHNRGVNLVLTSNSWAGGGFSQSLKNSIQASGDANMLFIAAAGNNNTDTDVSPNYPSGYDLANIISVAASDASDARASFSNYGAISVDLAAPGVSILSTVPTAGALGDPSGYRLSDGTSMATPHVSGVAALAWGIAPNATYQTIRDAIFAGVNPVPSMAGITVTGGRLNAFGTLQRIGMTVRGSDPAADTILSSGPTDFVLDFSLPLDASTLDASDLTVNLTPADSVALVDTDTATFHYNTSPVTAEGLQTMHMAAGAVKTTSTVPLDSSLREWSAAFRYDITRMQVLATVPSDQSTVVLPFTSLRVHVNEPIDPNTIGISDLVLNQGSVVSAVAVSPETVEYTLAGMVSEGVLAVVMPAGALTDSNGNPMLGYVGSLELDFGTVSFPSPLEPKEPRGSLIYEGAVTGSIRDGADTDSFALDLVLGHTITVVVDPTGGLQPTVTVFDPANALLGTASAPAGVDAVLQTVAAASPGVYRITVHDPNGSTGAYALRVNLNAAVEVEKHGGATNDTRATAQDVDAAFIDFGGAGRAAVLGQIEGDGFIGPDAFGYAAYPVPFTFEDIRSTGHSILVGVDDDLVALRKTDLAGFAYSLYGKAYSQVILGSNGQITFEWDRNGSTVLNNYPANRDLALRPGVATVAPLWDDLEIDGPGAAVYWEVRGSGSNQRLIVQWDKIRYFGGGPGEITFQAILYELDGSIQFNYLDLDNSVAGFTEGVSASVGIKDAGVQGGNQLPISLNGGPNRWVGSGLSTRIARAAAPTPSPDYYSFQLEQGQRATLAVLGLVGVPVNLELQDAGGNSLAAAAAGPRNLHALIDNFMAPATGTYYARITGGLGVEYSLVITRDTGIDLEANNDFTSTQDITGRAAILGAVARPDPVFATSGRIELDGPTGLAFGPDGNLYVASWYSGWVHGTGAAVLRYDGVSGAFRDVFASDQVPHNLPYVEGLTFGPDGNLYVTDDGGRVERYNGTTGAYLGNFASASRAKGLTFGPDGNLYVADAQGDSVSRFNGTTGALIDTFVASGSGGLDFPPHLVFGPDGNLYVSSFRTHQVLRYNGQTGQPLGVSGLSGDAVFISAGSGTLSGPWGLVFGPDGGGDGAADLIVASYNNDRVLRYDGVTGAFFDEFVSAGSNGLDSPSGMVFGPDGSLYVSSYSSDRVLRFGAPLRDIYTGTLADGDQINLATLTPLGALNGLDPMIRLYNSSGAVVASDDNSASDGRNAQLSYTVPAGLGGIYFVEVGASTSGSNLGGGEYVLSIDVVSPPQLTIDDITLSEGDGGTSSFTFTVARAGDRSGVVTVDFATADGTATTANNDYLGTSGTLTFLAGQTTRTISVTVNGDTTFEPDETFFVNLANASANATIADSQGVGTILDDDATKFYVVNDASTDRTYEYGATGSSVENYALNSGNTAPRGAASTAAGTTVWVVDANKTVYVYDTSGAVLGSWSAGGLNSNALLEGIATNGTDVWLVDRRTDKVYRYSNAASRTSGSQNSASSFSLASGNTDPKDLVTDGTSLWVVNDSSTGADKVFKYSISGTLLGSWIIDSANAKPTGITLDPTDVRHLWIVDSGTTKVYRYDDAAGLTTGSRAASASFALAAGNINPQGIADPPLPIDQTVGAIARSGDLPDQAHRRHARRADATVQALALDQYLATARAPDSLQHSKPFISDLLASLFKANEHLSKRGRMIG